MLNEFHRVKEVFPQSITILPTYRCNAECTECCFESNPRIKQRLSLKDIISAIDEALLAFPLLQLIIFSGGEVFLLKDDLYTAIAHARLNGVRVRCVTNAFWGKSKRTAKQVVEKLVAARVSEINISTGADHQEHVPFESVENACVALVNSGIVTLVTVESDSPTTNCLERIHLSGHLRPLLEKHAQIFSIQCNSWMPFHNDYVERGSAAGLDSLTDGCTQVFNNLVVTPYKNLAACCGLTFEHIPELTLGNLNSESMEHLFDSSLGDFLKVWIHIDGPATILRKLFGEEINSELKDIRHICQACAVLHLHPKVRSELSLRYQEFVHDVLARFALKVELRRREFADATQVIALAQRIEINTAI